MRGIIAIVKCVHNQCIGLENTHLNSYLFCIIGSVDL